MRIALLYPQVYDMARFRQHRKEFPPFGVLYLAAVLEAAGHDVRVITVVPHQEALDLTERLAFNQIGEALPTILIAGKVVGVWRWDSREHAVAYTLFRRRTSPADRGRIRLAARQASAGLRRGYDHGPRPTDPACAAANPAS